MTLRIEERAEEVAGSPRKGHLSIIVDQHRSSSAIATSSVDVRRRPESILEDGWVRLAEDGPGVSGRHNRGVLENGRALN
ncbi:hypothetical protein [Burkholderia cenocepacia]|uniref:hypothetical protein n=1 Tax=Burkholderia cenocepacia TaxID=95486 RepID=UPI000F5C016A|nr:hypothetical protein [Burkholderia cenocepacia]